ncbi:class I SAM-dependent methyltransferase [Ideonella sp.]|uniref:class I SAM-dependent methyltransferase n=1 Tax=Ideonella sp. TaxID=1929293 RepID=UPI0035B17A78
MVDNKATARSMERRNRAWYARPGTVRGMATGQGFTDEGERAAYSRLATEMCGRPILDLGVGPGRTVALLQSISHDYVGVDYAAPMLARARARYPAADLRLADARDLRAFGEETKALVVFSNHGIDSLAHADRHRVLREVWRVLEPGGVFWFSTLNLRGPAAHYRPWRPAAWSASGDAGRAAWPAGSAWLRAWLRVPAHSLRYWRARRLARADVGWAEAPFFAGGWRLVTHYVDLPELRRELARAGFRDGAEVLDDAHGRPVAADGLPAQPFSFAVIARKPGR